MLNLPSIFSCYRQNESGRLIMSPYYGIVFMLGETNCYSCGEGWGKKCVCNLCTTALSSGVTVNAGGL